VLESWSFDDFFDVRWQHPLLSLAIASDECCQKFIDAKRRRFQGRWSCLNFTRRDAVKIKMDENWICRTKTKFRTFTIRDMLFAFLRVELVRALGVFL